MAVHEKFEDPRNARGASAKMHAAPKSAVRTKDEVNAVLHEALPFGLHDTVHVDNDKTISMTAIAFIWRGAGMQVELSWFANGTHYSHWFDVERVSLSKD